MNYPNQIWFIIRYDLYYLNEIKSFIRFDLYYPHHTCKTILVSYKMYLSNIGILDLSRTCDHCLLAPVSLFVYSVQYLEMMSFLSPGRWLLWLSQNEAEKSVALHEAANMKLQI